jgi:hypothetical protein
MGFAPLRSECLCKGLYGILPDVFAIIMRPVAKMFGIRYVVDVFNILGDFIVDLEIRKSFFRCRYQGRIWPDFKISKCKMNLMISNTDYDYSLKPRVMTQLLPLLKLHENVYARVIGDLKSFENDYSAIAIDTPSASAMPYWNNM